MPVAVASKYQMTSANREPLGGQGFTGIYDSARDLCGSTSKYKMTNRL